MGVDQGGGFPGPDQYFPNVKTEHKVGTIQGWVEEKKKERREMKGYSLYKFSDIFKSRVSSASNKRNVFHLFDDIPCV